LGATADFAEGAGLLAELDARPGITPVQLGDDLEELVVTLEADHLNIENCLPHYAPGI
jgi:hypothetical protein